MHEMKLANLSHSWSRLKVWKLCKGVNSRALAKNKINLKKNPMSLWSFAGAAWSGYGLLDCMQSLLIQCIITNNNQRRHFEDDVCLEFWKYLLGREHGTVFSFKHFVVPRCIWLIWSLLNELWLLLNRFILAIRGLATVLLLLIIVWASLLENSLWCTWIMDASTSCAVCTHPKMEAPRPTPPVFIKIPFGKRKHQLPFLCITWRRNNFDAHAKAGESFWHAERMEWCLQWRERQLRLLSAGTFVSLQAAARTKKKKYLHSKAH